MPLAGYSYYRPLTDANSVAGSPACRLALTASNFSFSRCRADGGDLRVYDETAGATVPYWLRDFDPIGQAATLWYKPADNTHAHRLYYGNPSAPSAASFSSVFSHGSGFDADWGDLTTRVAGSGKATRLAGQAGASDPRRFAAWRIAESPTLNYGMLTAAGVTGGTYTGVRECSIPIDGDNGNRVTKVNGKYYITFARRPTATTDKIDTWRAESTGKDGPWANFAQIYSPPGTVRLGYASCVLKVGSTYYCYLSYGWDTSGALTPGLSVYVMKSPDMLTWSAPVKAVDGGIFTDQVDGSTVTDIGNPGVICCADGKFMMVVEGRGPAGGHWGIYGCIAAAPDAAPGSWTALNTGHALTSLPTAGQWDYGGYNDANPKPLQLPDGSYVLLFNGSDANDATYSDWQHGFATSSDRNVQFAKSAYNPIAGRSTSPLNYGLEVSACCWDEDGTSIFNLGQRFVTTSATAEIYRLYPLTTPGGLLYPYASNADAAFAGVLVGTGTFAAESYSWQTAHREYGAGSSAAAILGLYDAASVPAAGGAATFARRLEIQRGGHEQSPAGTLYLVYWDTGGARHYWTGSAWTTTATSLDTDVARPIRATLADDGVNYILSIVYADDGSDVPGNTNPASIAKTSVQAFASGNRCLVAGDPFTDNWASPIFLRYLHTRPYFATEPAISAGAEAGGPSPAALVAGTASFAWTGPGGVVVAATDAFGGVQPYARRWQKSTDGGATWANLSNGAGVSGAYALTLTDSSAAPGGMYRLAYSDAQATPATATSNAVTAPRYGGGGGGGPRIGAAQIG